MFTSEIEIFRLQVGNQVLFVCVDFRTAPTYCFCLDNIYERELAALVLHGFHITNEYIEVFYWNR